MFWLTITHIQVYTTLELWFSVVHHKIEIALASILIPQADDFIQFCMKKVPLLLGERHL
jgi:hypothetical protein